MWVALKLLASGALDAVLRGLSVALKWLLADWRNAVVGTVLPAFAWMALVTAPELRADLAEAETSLAAEEAAHLGTVNAFLAASAQAQREAEANAARVRAEQEKITDATLADLRSDHAALRLRFDRLRARGAAAADPRHAGSADLPQLPAAPGRAVAAPGDHDLRSPGELIGGDLTGQPLCPARFVCLTIDQAEQASIDAHNHDRLIDWVIAQSAILFIPTDPRQ